MPEKRDAILQEMTKIYIMFCLPRVTLNTKTQEVTIEYIWQNDDAKKNFELLGEMLKIENIALLEQKYAQHHMHLTGLRCPVHELKMVNGYCPSLTCLYSPPRK